MRLWAAIAGKISEALGEPVAPQRVRPLEGGCITNAVALETEAAAYFVKHTQAARLEMFAAEAAGLEALRAAGALRVPSPICWGIVENVSFLALEYLAISPAGAAAQEQLGHRLAALHRVTHPRYGWHLDNTIGSTLQRNTYTARWVDFLREHRLGLQFELAGRNGYEGLAKRGERLLHRLETLFGDYECSPSLLHGDLWHGNQGALSTGEPVVFDPAVYFGDRETDVAMTELFGGFSDRFYAAYNEEWPLAPGYATRRTLYNLYHILNHLNLFGGAYAGQADAMLQRVLRETG